MSHDHQLVEEQTETQAGAQEAPATLPSIAHVPRMRTFVIAYDEESDTASAVITRPNGERVLFPLDYDALGRVMHMAGRARSQMEWHRATWLYVHSVGETRHLKRYEHATEEDDERMKHGPALCGRTPPSYQEGTVRFSWSISPVVGEPYRERSIALVCRTCLAAYDREMAKQAEEGEAH